VSDPYRDGGHRDVVEAPVDRGIVGDVIAQFADPYAFYRELVQNSIDAGSTEIHVELSYDEAAQKLRASVRDRGEGMSRDVIENQLLVLFRSTKEKDKTKIGKFGVGFKSVLSPNPDIVIVHSVRDGKKHTLHLYRDLTYDLFDAGRATQAGTTVELELPTPREEIAEVERKTEMALRRWCRHASVPITMTIRRGDQKKEVRIDSPLSFGTGHLEVRKELDDGELIIVAGIPKNGQPYLGFFNHGLMLHETNTLVELPKVQIKIQDSRLGHTISRDDVRRDDHYKRAMNAARAVVLDELAVAASNKLREHAEQGTSSTYCELLEAVVDAELRVAEVHLPLVEPIGEKKTIVHTDTPGRVWTAKTSTELTKALASAGTAVVHVTNRNTFEKAFSALERSMVAVDAELTAVTLCDMTDDETALCGFLRDMLDDVHRAPAKVVIAELRGARDDLLAVAISNLDQRVLDSDDAVKSPFALLGRRAIALSKRHPHMIAARATDDPQLAASHLVRAVLLQYGLLDATRSRKLLDLTLSKIGVAR